MNRIVNDPNYVVEDMLKGFVKTIKIWWKKQKMTEF